MKRLFCILLVMMTLLSVATAEEWCSIADIREQTPARWTQTYETKWPAITMDTAIECRRLRLFPS